MYKLNNLKLSNYISIALQELASVLATVIDVCATVVGQCVVAVGQYYKVVGQCAGQSLQ